MRGVCKRSASPPFLLPSAPIYALVPSPLKPLPAHPATPCTPTLRRPRPSARALHPLYCAAPLAESLKEALEPPHSLHLFHLLHLLPSAPPSPLLSARARSHVRVHVATRHTTQTRPTLVHGWSPLNPHLRPSRAQLVPSSCPVSVARGPALTPPARLLGCAARPRWLPSTRILARRPHVRIPCLAVSGPR